MNSKSIVLSFDLDFTLIDNKEGIINSFNYALKKHGFRPVAPLKIEKMIGTPLNEMFQSINMKIDPLTLARSFREYYGKQGIFQARLFPEVLNLLDSLRETKHILGIVTSKKEEMAHKITKILNIDHFFDYILGETKDRKLGKTDPKLKDLLLKKYPQSSFIIIGDHINDRKFAEMLNCPFIGVLTGHQSKIELEKGKKTKIVIIEKVTDITRDLISSLI